MTRRRLIVASLALPASFAFSLAAGCQATVRPPIEGKADPYAATQVSFATEQLRQRTAVMPPNLQRDDAGNLLHVSLPIRSTYDRAFTVDYQVQFFDRNGSLLSQTGWLPLPLEANSPAVIQANSMSDRAADFHVSLRPAK